VVNVPLHDFIGNNRKELIRRCQEKVAIRSAAPPLVVAPDAEIEHGVPLFLDQLVSELRNGPSNTHEIRTTAMKHGHDLLLRGLSMSQVVHGYGDVCQAVTDLAVELETPIETDAFRTLNRCLDDAIASAVTEHARRQEVTRDGASAELRKLSTAAITAFEVLQSENVEIAGTTEALGVHRSLMALRAFTDRSSSAKLAH
jgi:hypothetical protein